MAAIGDSITLGVGAEPVGYGVAPAYSWATGDALVDGVRSHYERLLELEPQIKGNNHNLARGGARMTHARRQARRAIRLGVDYVTILLGGNDLCGRRSGELTPLANFEKHIDDALQLLTRGLPQVHVYVLSIPNIYEMWDALRADPMAMQMWAMAGTCRALLSPDATVVRAFRDHNLAYNEILERVCRRFDRCRFDEHAVYKHAYSPEYLSLDFFHPSYLGQRQLAEVSWRSGYWSEAAR
ncbi:MAG: GDSL-type esterase/lipase family protein [Actinomycetota bacterium]|nr:GDSL-type esterase/lipase family protein [Actinomycetota bacterium]